MKNTECSRLKMVLLMILLIYSNRLLLYRRSHSDEPYQRNIWRYLSQGTLLPTGQLLCHPLCRGNVQQLVWSQQHLNMPAMYCWQVLLRNRSSPTEWWLWFGLVLCWRIHRSSAARKPVSGGAYVSQGKSLTNSLPVWLLSASCWARGLYRVSSW